MLDVYTLGSVKRISPEAPVPVLCVEEESRRPGGAGNAILNLASLGMQIKAVGRVGPDDAGRYFVDALNQEGIDVRGILFDPHYRTPLKSRMIADNQQLLRVDYEKVAPIEASFENTLSTLLPNLLEDVNVIAISDYGKGLLTRSFLSHVIALGKQLSIPIIVDPKGMDFSKYKGATVLKPNLSEAMTAAGLGPDASLDDVGFKLLTEIDVQSLMVTRSKEGISLFNHKEKRRDFPAHVHEVKDVTGAGDTVLAVITAALANTIDLGVAAHLANVAAGIAIERIGCARISLAELAGRLAKIS